MAIEFNWNVPRDAGLILQEGTENPVYFLCFLRSLLFHSYRAEFTRSRTEDCVLTTGENHERLRLFVSHERAHF